MVYRFSEEKKGENRRNSRSEEQFSRNPHRERIWGSTVTRPEQTSLSRKVFSENSTKPPPFAETNSPVWVNHSSPVSSASSPIYTPWSTFRKVLLERCNTRPLLWDISEMKRSPNVETALETKRRPRSDKEEERNGDLAGTPILCHREERSDEAVRRHFSPLRAKRSNLRLLRQTTKRGSQ